MDITTAGKQLAKLVEDLPTTGPVKITKYGKVVAILTRAVEDEAFRRPQPIIEPKIVEPPKLTTAPKATPNPDRLRAFGVSDTPPHPGINTIPNTAKQQQAARDALLNAMNRKPKK